MLLLQCLLAQVISRWTLFFRRSHIIGSIESFVRVSIGFADRTWLETVLFLSSIIDCKVLVCRITAKVHGASAFTCWTLICLILIQTCVAWFLRLQFAKVETFRLCRVGRDIVCISLMRLNLTDVIHCIYKHHIATIVSSTAIQIIHNEISISWMLVQLLRFCRSVELAQTNLAFRIERCGNSSFLILTVLSCVYYRLCNRIWNIFTIWSRRSRIWIFCRNASTSMHALPDLYFV